MRKVKLVILGPFNTGKTSLVKTLCNKSLSIEAPLTNPLKNKKTTTIALDYGVTRFNDFIVYVFGTPGQKRFSFVREAVKRGANAIIFVVDEITIENNEVLQEVRKLKQENIPLIIAINIKGSGEIKKKVLDRLKREAPVIFFSAIDRKSVSNLLQTTLKIYEEWNIFKEKMVLLYKSLILNH